MNSTLYISLLLCLIDENYSKVDGLNHITNGNWNTVISIVGYVWLSLRDRHIRLIAAFGKYTFWFVW